MSPHLNLFFLLTPTYLFFQHISYTHISQTKSLIPTSYLLLLLLPPSFLQSRSPLSRTIPKPTQAELLQRYSGPIIPSKPVVKAALDGSVNKNLAQSRIGRDQSQGAGEASSVVASTSLDQAVSVSAEQLQDYLSFSVSLTPCLSLSPACSLSSLAEPLIRPSSDENDSSGWSDFESTDEVYRQMCNPTEAKALSIATGRFYAVFSLDQDALVPGDEPQVDGMILHGYTDGKPIYYKYSG